MNYTFSYYIYISLYLVFIFIFTIKTTKYVLRYSHKHALIDNPGERTSHSIPTPRGGGVSISIVILLTSIILTFIELISTNIFIAFCAGGLLVSVVGWIDDHKDIAAGWRGILYLLASIIALVYIGGLEQIKFGGLFIHLNLAGSILAVIGLTWLTNLYNFMDGTDAIASVQAITTGSFAGILFFINNQVGLAIICFVIIMSCVGFLTWNWPPAKIFMGDVGSCMIGYTFGVMAIIGEVTNTVYIYIWIILLAVFIWDATFTLVKRIIYGEKWYVAHRTHAYQRLIQLGISHSTLAIYLILLNICVLWPIAYIAYRWVYLSVYMMLLSIIIVLSLWSIIQYIYYKSENQVINGNPSDG